jgi:drug/metabolite transporter (DMT)-like permease
VTYFYALKLSNVAIGMLAVFTYPIITVLLEPLFFKTRISITHLLLGGLVLIGIYFLSPEMSLENTQVKGLIFGIISAFFYAVRNILMKKKVATYHGSLLMFYQMLVVIALLWPAFFFFEASPSGNDWLALGTLALLTTAVGHTLFVMSFKHFSIGTASIMSSIQPVYGIVFGILLLDEVPDLKTMVGGSLILLSVLVESIQSNRPQK